MVGQGPQQDVEDGRRSGQARVAFDEALGPSTREALLEEAGRAAGISAA